MNCIFCDIINQKKSAKMTYQDEWVIAFEDLHPQAPCHQLIIPKKHITTINDIVSEDNELIGHMIQIAKKLAKKFNIAEEGYRLVFNCNAGGGQSVFHIHIHLLGGRSMQWPPG